MAFRLQLAEQTDGTFFLFPYFYYSSGSLANPDDNRDRAVLLMKPKWQTQRVRSTGTNCDCCVADALTVSAPSPFDWVSEGAEDEIQGREAGEGVWAHLYCRFECDSVTDNKYYLFHEENILD